MLHVYGIHRTRPVLFTLFLQSHDEVSISLFRNQVEGGLRKVLYLNVLKVPATSYSMMIKNNAKLTLHISTITATLSVMIMPHSKNTFFLFFATYR